MVILAIILSSLFYYYVYVDTYFNNYSGFFFKQIYFNIMVQQKNFTKYNSNNNTSTFKYIKVILLGHIIIIK